MKEKNQLERRLPAFAHACVAICENMPTHPRGAHVADQLFRAATRAAATHNEALGASTRKDFRFKLCETLKETREARFWLGVAKAAGWKVKGLTEAIDEANQLVAMLTAAVKTLSE